MHLIQPYFDFNYLCLFATILLFGNGYSIFLHGNGGKGVATLCGLLASLYPAALIPSLGMFVITLLLTKTVGIASVAAVACLPVYAYTTINNTFFLFSLFAAAFIIWKHKSNIQVYWNNR